MNVLLELIKSMSKYECRYFKILANRTNQSTARKDILLFDYFRKHVDNCDEKKIAKKLYGNNINAYYRLKSRLLSDLKNSLTLNYLNKDEELLILKHLFIARDMHNKGQNTLSMCFLIDTEKKARKKNLTHLLKLVYDEMIKMSHTNNKIDVESLLNKRKENRRETNRIQEVNDVLRALNYRLKRTQNYSSKDNKTLLILENTVKEFVQDNKLMKNVKMKMKIYQSISSILQQKHDFQSLETYLNHTYKDFLKSKVFNRNNHNTKLQILTYQMNCLCKNGKHKESLEKANELKKEMEQFNKLYYKKYLFYYYNGLATNYNKIDKKKAIEVLLKAKNEPIIKKSDYNYFFVCSKLVLQYFDTKNYKLAIKTLSRMILHTSFLHFDSSFQLKIITAELIIRYEIGDFDYLEERMKKVNKKYKEELRSNGFEREKLVLKIIHELIFNEKIEGNEALLKHIEQLLSKASDEQSQDGDIISYSEWIAKKLD